MNRAFYIAIAALSLVACGSTEKTVSRPEPPTFVATGNKPSKDVAIDFMLRYSAVAKEAIERTPYAISDPTKQSVAAQKLYKDDGNYLVRWAEAGESLFKAADIQVCQLFVAAVFSTWKTAYPLNGPVSESEMAKKREVSAYSNEKAEQCKQHLSMQWYGK